MTPAQIIEELISAGTPTRLVAEVARIFGLIDGLSQGQSRDTIVDNTKEIVLVRGQRGTFALSRDTIVENATDLLLARRDRDRIRKQKQRSRHVTSADKKLALPDPQEKERKVSPTPPLKKENSTPLEAQAPRDIRKDLFSTGLRLLAEMTGKTPDSCRSTLGKWLKFVDDEAIHVLGAIEDANRNMIANPIPWIFERLKPYGRGKPNGFHPKTTRQVGNELIAELREKTMRQDEPGRGNNGGDEDAGGIPRNRPRSVAGLFDDPCGNTLPVPSGDSHPSLFSGSWGSEDMQILSPDCGASGRMVRRAN